MARTLRVTIEWEDEGLPDKNPETGEAQGYLAFVLGLGNLGAEIIDEVEV